MHKYVFPRYMPKPKVTGSGEDNLKAMRAHFHQQIILYGEQVVINLINQKKYEGQLEQTFRKFVADLAINDVHYEAFDFHKECSKMRYDNLILLKTRQLDRYNFGSFLKRGESSVISNQVSEV